MESFKAFEVAGEQAGKTVAALVREQVPTLSWSTVKRLVEGRRARVNGEVCLDSARRLKLGETLELMGKPASLPFDDRVIRIRHVDEHVVVVEKPSGVNTVRHPLEREWNDKRRKLAPTLEDLVFGMITENQGRKPKKGQGRLRIVHRLDKETSGLVVFARTPLAERVLGQQFHDHSVIRRYLALIEGSLESKKIESRLIRDRGDGRRGSTDLHGVGKEAITHVEVKEKLKGFTLLQCRLETGRTHQIRIHLAEQGHPVCGDKVYSIRRDGKIVPDGSKAPRLALHAFELGFVHPATGENLHWSMPLPPDLEELLKRLRGNRHPEGNRGT